MTTLDATRREHVPSTPAAAGAAWHTAAAEELAAAGRWEQAYQHLRTAVRLLNGRSGVDELDRLRREHAEAREQSRRDSLTETYNRRYLDERLVALVREPGSVGPAGIAVALLDVDHFKQINDTYGHPFGDRVLQRIVAVIESCLPEGSFCARYGGEEFAIVLPGHDRHEAVRVCETARERVDGHPWPELAPGLRVTVSIGVAHGFGPVTGQDGLIASADRLLYAAKHSGRNAVAFHDAHTGLVRLAGPAAGRRSLPQAPVAAPDCLEGPSAP
ncbi:MAG TPA: GGDEF domain-containing protein [Pseudonocardia sp.]|jgi:diguanylate cyclase (GGDEF)-like protein|uniref:GGDEF domain-containing protein n=1 Tax=Pseudonocardia sp. TaxID=60912 RepID=UPI002B4B2EF7|nr:GGDEF domain-containing protein [Pseudonocardia sp.]HLU58529.1 GGDEF domain-containing protein [Pseudonocardia sp.]